ncbi:MAG: WYL domain-containing protein [Verrucomicrobiota bacterium]
MKSTMKKPPVTADRLSRPPLARMLRIHEQLKSDRLPNCSQLALALEVATKTVQRDIEFMRDRMDLPIEFDFRRNGFHYTTAVENFPTVQVTEQELIALYVAEKSLAQYKGTPFEKPLHAAFEKLTEGLTDTVSFRWADLDSALSFKSMGTTVADLELFEIVSRAVLRSQELEFKYHKLVGQGHEPRRVQPYHLGCIDNQWYLFAFDLDRQQIRTFVLGRMKDVHSTGKRFTRPADFSLTKHLGDSFGVYSPAGKPQEVRIRFDAFAARLVRERRWHASQKIKELPAGEIELTLKLANLTEVQRWVLSWGEHARVLAPAELRDNVRLTLEKMIESYGHAPVS